MILSLIIPADCYPLRFTYWGHHFYLSGNVWKYFHFCCNWCVVQIIHFFFLEWYPLIETLTLWSNPTTLIWYSGIGFFTPSYWPWNAKKPFMFKYYNSNLSTVLRNWIESEEHQFTRCQKPMVSLAYTYIMTLSQLISFSLLQQFTDHIKACSFS